MNYQIPAFFDTLEWVEEAIFGALAGLDRVAALRIGKLQESSGMIPAKASPLLRFFEYPINLSICPFSSYRLLCFACSVGSSPCIFNKLILWSKFFYFYCFSRSVVQSSALI